MEHINGIPDLKSRIGKQIGTSPWATIDQGAINNFADATLDHNFIHVDPTKAAATPFGGTIAHGYHSLSLIAGLIQQTFQLDAVRMGLNYGIDRARFPQAVPNGSRVRLHVHLNDVLNSKTDDGSDCYYRCIIELEGSEKPACVADIIFRYYPNP